MPDEQEQLVAKMVSAMQLALANKESKDATLANKATIISVAVVLFGIVVSGITAWNNLSNDNKQLRKDVDRLEKQGPRSHERRLIKIENKLGIPSPDVSDGD